MSAELTEAKTTLQSVIDGSIDLMAPELADRLEAIYYRHQRNTEIMALFERAAQAYSSYMIEQAKAILELSPATSGQADQSR